MRNGHSLFFILMIICIIGEVRSSSKVGKGQGKTTKKVGTQNIKDKKPASSLKGTDKTKKSEKETLSDKTSAYLAQGIVGGKKINVKDATIQKAAVIPGGTKGKSLPKKPKVNLKSKEPTVQKISFGARSDFDAVPLAGEKPLPGKVKASTKESVKSRLKERISKAKAPIGNDEPASDVPRDPEYKSLQNEVESLKSTNESQKKLVDGLNVKLQRLQKKSEQRKMNHKKRGEKTLALVDELNRKLPSSSRKDSSKTKK